MIVQLTIYPIFALLHIIIARLPIGNIPPVTDYGGIPALFSILGYMFHIFPLSMFLMILTNIIFWLTAQMLWAIIEWFYKKIPGVN